jgi:protein arginine N-methyltransferase 1
VYNIDDYGSMIAEPLRIGAYARALEAAIRPGDVVLDIGTGTGIFPLFACRFGASRVHAIESAPYIQLARETAAANGVTERVVFHEGSSLRVDLPEKVDVIVSDLRGLLPLYRRNLGTIIDARRRFLAPGGRVVPVRDDLWMAPVEAPSLAQKFRQPWCENPWDFDLRAGLSLAANTVARGPFGPQHLLGAPMRYGAVDYERAETVGLQARAQMRIERDGEADGLAAWFDSVLFDDIVLSNAPGAPPAFYGQAFLRWPKAVKVAAGDVVEVDLRADLVGADYVWSWQSAVRRAGGVVAESFRQSTFLAEPMTPSMMQAISSRHIPDLGEDGEIDMLVLEHMRGRTSLGEIAAVLAARYPRRFTGEAEALRHVAELSLRYRRMPGESR